MALRMKKTEHKNKLKLIIQCIADRGNVEKLLEELKMKAFRRHVIEVEKLYGRGCFLKMELGDLLGGDFDQLLMLNEKLDNLNVISNGVHRIDILH